MPVAQPRRPKLFSCCFACFAIQGDTPAHLVNKWGKDTLDHYLQLYQSPEAPAAGMHASWLPLAGASRRVVGACRLPPSTPAWWRCMS